MSSRFKGPLDCLMHTWSAGTGAATILSVQFAPAQLILYKLVDAAWLYGSSPRGPGDVDIVWHELTWFVAQL
ncbi:hypothetical protein BT96DRAFT_1008528 [Gymnopus androsaceus JB14]|uniref:Uncharacterized protein n=1 Tax=Gymnopus androsaceus JB14 TaxID=1447944 RepID=A0A6A4GF45_9AGAR|nr:hypothetical protein BT96DRAFT_1008528 [Gymnopus androsaceus JB14]